MRTMKSLLSGLRGPDLARARALAGRVTRARFALGQVVREPHGELGAIDAIYADLLAAEEAGVIDDGAAWLRMQEIRPRTGRRDPWYSVVLANGNALCGERDLRGVRASRKPRRK
jgi:hypothetical protein